MPRISRRRAWLMLILSNVIFAGAYVSGKDALSAVSPVMLNALRFTLASIVLLPVVFHHRSELKMSRSNLLIFITVSLCSFVFNKLFEYIGLSLSTASDAALLISGEGIFTALLAWIILRETVTGLRIGALIMGFLGAYLIIERGLWPHFATSPTTALRITGDALFVLSLVFEAFASVISKRLAGTFSPLIVSSATIVGSLIVWIPAGIIDYTLHGLHLTILAVGGILYLGLMVTAVAYFLWFGGLQVIDGAAAAVTLFLQPLFGTLLAVVLLGEYISFVTLLGGICIIASMWMISRPAPHHLPAEDIMEMIETP